MIKRAIILALVLLSVQFSYSQIKLFSDGCVSIGTKMAPFTHHKVYIYGARLTLGGWEGRYYKFDFSPSDPRWWSTTNQVTFYDTEKRRYNTVKAGDFKKVSDERYKTDINRIDNALDKVLNINGVSYYWKDDENNLKSGEEKKHDYGFIAQQLETVLPDLVDTDDTLGHKSISYMGILPYVVEAIKELDGKVTTQQEYIEQLEAQANIITSQGDNLIEQRNKSKLYANQPNPFNNETLIGYFVKETSSKAIITIYDLNGKQIMVKNIDKFGEGHVKVLANELDPGMYLYSLLVDGIEIDTKKMIVTE